MKVSKVSESRSESRSDDGLEMNKCEQSEQSESDDGVEKNESEQSERSE
jgi:hypothetical protein